MTSTIMDEDYKYIVEKLNLEVKKGRKPKGIIENYLDVDINKDIEMIF